MITSVFRKSTPINLFLVIILMLVFFLSYQFQDKSWTSSTIYIVEKGLLFVVLMGSIFITNFIVKRNGLSRDSSYTILFYFLFLLFFPSIFSDIKLVLANFFILLALRRLISLQSLQSSKEKIFDASLWIFVASIFHFWCILYIVLVFMSIIIHVSRDYRNWVLPFIAFFVVGVCSVIAAFLLSINVVAYITSNAMINLRLDYFINNYQNAAFSIYATVALFFVVSMFYSLTTKPLLLQTSYKKVITAFFIGVVIFVISNHKSNDLLLFTIVPLTIMATSHIEIKQLKLKQEMVLFVLIACSLFTFFSQL